MGAGSYVFDSLEEATQFLKDLPDATGHRVEGEAAASLGSEGVNAIKMFSDLASQHKDDLETLAQMGSDGAGRNSTSMPPPPSEPPSNPAPEYNKDIPLFRVGIGRKIRPTKEVFLDAEQATKVPIFSQVYQPLEAARIDNAKFLHTWQPSVDEINKQIPSNLKEGYFHGLLEPPDSVGREAVINEFGLDRGRLQQIDNWGKKLFDGWGLDWHDFTNKQIPRILEDGGIDASYSDVNIPPEARLYATSFRDGTLPWWLDPGDITKFMNGVLHRGGWHQTVETPWLNAVKFSNTRFTQGMPPSVATLVDGYLKDIQGYATPNEQAVLQGIGRGMYAIGKRFGKYDPQDTLSSGEVQQMGRKFFGWMYALNYSANLSFRAAAVMRQYLQTIQTTLPRFGVRAVFGDSGGVARALTKEGQDLVSRSGALIEEAPFAGEEGVPSIGGKIFRSSDNFQRSIAALAQDTRFTRALGRLKTDGDWNGFLRRSDVEDFHPIIQGQVQQMLQSGNEMDARLRVMREASEDTQFIYRKGNRPELFRGMGGRLIGQYGVFPVYYGEYLAHLFGRGSLQSRVMKASRFIAANAITYEAFKNVLGANPTAWLFFAPLQFQGGPMLQIGTDIPKAFGDGPEAHLARSRLLPNAKNPLGAAGQFVPGYQAARDVFGALGQDYPIDVVRRLLGYPPAKNP